MIVEELIAKLGFKTEGLGDLKKFENGMKNADSGLKKFGKTLHDKFAGGASAIFPRIANALKSGVSGAASFAMMIGKVALGVGVMVAGMGLAALAVLKLAQAFVRARGEAALLRREMQLDAKGNRTTIGNIEKLQKGFEAIGAKPEQAKELVESVAKKVDESIRKKDYGDFKNAGVNPLNKDGSRKDTTGVTLDLLAKYNEIIKAGQDARRRQHTYELPGVGNPKKAAQEKKIANEKEVAASEFADKWGITPELQARFMALAGGMAEFQKRMEEFNKNNPGLTRDQEERKAQIADEYAKFKNTMEGLSNAVLRPLGDLADKITLSVLPALNSFAEGLLKILKLVGISPETKGEVQDREKRRAEIGKVSPEVKKALDAANNAHGASGPLDAAHRNYIAKAIAAVNAGPDTPSETRAKLDSDLKAAAAALVEAAKKFGETQEKALDPSAGSSGFGAIIDALKSIVTNTSPAENAAKTTSAAAKNIKIDPIKVGGEAIVTVPPIKVEASPDLKATIAKAEAVAKMKINGASGATVVKGSNVNTSAPTAP